MRARAARRRSTPSPTRRRSRQWRATSQRSVQKSRCSQWRSTRASATRRQWWPCTSVKLRAPQSTAGADVVIAHHAHILRGVDVYKGRPIFHGLGNFVAVTRALNLEANPSPERVAWARRRRQLFGFEPDPAYPTYPFHPEARNAMLAVCRFEGGQVRARVRAVLDRAVRTSRAARARRSRRGSGRVRQEHHRARGPERPAGVGGGSRDRSLRSITTWQESAAPRRACPGHPSSAHPPCRR